MIADARARLVARGFTEAVLWVLVGNERAQRFYRIDGWRPEDVKRTIEIWGVEIFDERFQPAAAVAPVPAGASYWYMMNSGTGSISSTCSGVSIGLSFL